MSITNSKLADEKRVQIFVKTNDDDEIHFTGNYAYDGTHLEISDGAGDVVAVFAKCEIKSFWVMGKVIPPTELAS